MSHRLPSQYGTPQEIAQNKQVTNKLFNALANPDLDNPYHRYSLYKFSHGRTTFFLCPPHLLDTTQPHDVSDNVNTHLIEDRPDKLSCHKNLRPAVTNKTHILRGGTNKYGIIPEYNAHEERRCVYVHPSGVRCNSYGKNAVCHSHIRVIMNTPATHQEMTFRSTTLKEAYQKHLNSPNNKSLNTELALMRGCLDLMLQKLQMDSAQDIGIILQITEKITTCVDKMSGIEARLKMRMTPEQVNNLLIKMIGFVTEMFNPTPEQLRQLADRLESHQEIVEVEGYPVNGQAKLTTALTRYSETTTETTTKEAHLEEQILKHTSFAAKTNIPERNRSEAAKSAERARDELEALRKGTSNG